MPTSNTEELVRAAAEGDLEARRMLLERHRDRLRRMVSSRLDPRVRTRLDPSDVIQEALIIASSKMDDYLARQPIPFYPWLRQIAWERLLHMHDRHLRTAKRTVDREQRAHPGVSDASAMLIAERFIGRASSPSAVAVRQEMQQRVREALAEVNESDREVLLMRHLEQMSSREIGAVMDLSEAAVNMRHMRALERLRKVLSRDMREY